MTDDEDRVARWVDLRDAATLPVALVGGKARSLGTLLSVGLPAPSGVVITTATYREFVESSGLSDRVAMEVGRKPATEYRWEELWDAAHRIRSWFLGASWPEGLFEAVSAAFDAVPGTRPFVVRSSAPHEDSAERSFAGIHESVIGVEEGEAALEAVREVWASLFSDRALLYHDELGLDPHSSSMAVVIQRLASSERSGIAFTRDPVAAGNGVIEAVWGLGEGLVSDRVEPDRWTVSRRSGEIAAHTAPDARDEALVLSPSGPVLVELGEAERRNPPLAAGDVGDIWALAREAEDSFGDPQDCEWTYDSGSPLLTQARPITTLPDDERRDYLALEPSLEHLERLSTSIEDERLPRMLETSRALAAVDLRTLSDHELAEHAASVIDQVGFWRGVYRDEFIPFAHGARLFGSTYLSLVRPSDPFEFVLLLARTSAELDRHRALLSELGIDYPSTEADPERRAALETEFLRRAEKTGVADEARRVLELGRASWRLRDDDNLYLEMIERAARSVADEVGRRIEGPNSSAELKTAYASLAGLSEGSLDSSRPEIPQKVASERRSRQLVGQPASPGVASGTARIATSADAIADLGESDILVADALEPDTAAYAARAGGIVERRGGMLVHGAIVARERGLPCVTGVTDATRLIAEGEEITVDGYLGIVVLNEV